MTQETVEDVKESIVNELGVPEDDIGAINDSKLTFYVGSAEYAEATLDREVETLEEYGKEELVKVEV